MSEEIDKKSLSERDICTKYITPALVNRGWNINTQMREEVTLTKGRVIVRGRLTSRGEQKRADYVLYHKPGVPLAVIEAKDNNHSISAGMQQAIATGKLIDVPFIFSSNGDAFISDYLKATERFAKTIIFCETTDHAERMRVALVNENADLVAENNRYIMRITGDDAQGKAELDNFIDPESKYPTIVTTSELLTTGVDAKTCKLIVLDQRILSMSKFKQIIGRGTRIDEDYGKMFFTIMDFKRATQLFVDPDFDGEPVQIYQPKPVDSIVPPDEDEIVIDGEMKRKQKREKYVVADEEVAVALIREQYYGKDGKLITESIKDYTRKTVSQEYASLDAFLKKWNTTEQKQAIIQELQVLGVPLAALETEIGQDFDPLDLICHVVYDQPPLTRKERANNVRKRNYFSKYGEQVKMVLNALLDKYADQGIEDIESLDVLKVKPISDLGTPLEIISIFGSKQAYLAALSVLKAELYRVS